MLRSLFLLIIGTGMMMTACKELPKKYRVATYNIKELSMEKLIDVDEDGCGQNAQILDAAEIIQRIRPDILIINEIDHEYGQYDVDVTGPAMQFVRAYLDRGSKAIDYPYIYAAPCNTGIPSGRDLNGDGGIARMGDPRSFEFAGDCYGWGEYPGQYSMALLSRFPIDVDNIRTFQSFLWSDLPGNHLPVEYYKENADCLRLSSKSHWDIPVHIGAEVLHMFLCHPTPPGFDGVEDRNGRRNFDELKFWVHYLIDDPALVDDQGKTGGCGENINFMLAGDFNADPSNDAIYEGVTAIGQLLHHPRIQDSSECLFSSGGAEGRIAGPPSFPERYTARFGKDSRMRIDYLLPSAGLKVINGGVFWPSKHEDKAGNELAEKASDHRLIWMDLVWPQSSGQ
ncbi:endonuclease/exonuclease/phosphatase family protein [bacterium]|nr:endonuclease/exonuclease/phosphatase family protein [bacterium]